MKNRILSLVLTLVMILSLFPVIQLPASAASLPWIREMDNDPSVGKTTHDVYLRFKSDGDIGSTVIGNNCDACFLAITFPAGATWGSAYDNGHASTTKIEPYGYGYKTYTKYFGKNFMTNSSDYIEIWINDVDSYPTDIFIDIQRVGSSRSYHGDIYCTVDGQVIVNKNNWGTKGGSAVSTWYGNDSYVPLASAKVNISTGNVIKPSGTVSIPYTVTGKDSMGGDVAEPVYSDYSNNSLLYSRGVVVSEKLVAATSTANFSCSGVTLDPSSKQIKVDGAAFNSAKKTQKFRIATTVSLGANSVYDEMGFPITDPLIFGGTKTFYSDVITLYPGEGTINYNANGGSGSMASQNITYGTDTKLANNTFTYNPTLTFRSDIGTLDVPSVSVPASFGGWMDKTTTTFNGKTYPYYEFDAAGYANRNGDVLASSAFGNGVYDKEAMLRHYIAYGKNEYENGSANRAAATGYFGTYPDGATVKNLAGESGGVVSLYAKWNYGTTTLPTPTTDGYTFRSWTADLMDIATLTDNLEISDTTRGTIGYNDGYALTENLIPVIGGTTFTSNMEVCGVYAYDKDGNFLKRCSSYATTHTVPYAAAFVRVEVCTKKELSFEDFKNLSLEYSVPAGTVVPVAGNQTYTANWQGHYNIRFDANGGKGGTENYVVMGSSRYSDVSWLTVSRKGYEFAGWTTEPDGTELVYGADGHCVPGSAYWDGSGNWKHDGDVVVYAKWTPLPVTITAQTTAGGSVTGTKTVNAGENVELLATAEDGYEFAGWYDGETLVCETENFTVENVIEDKTYTAQFKEYVCNHSHDGVEFKPWKNSKSLPSSTGNYYLATDVTISEEWTAPAGEFNLCLNGKSINLNSKHIAVKNGATLNIYDCGDTVRYYDADSTTGKWTLKSEGTSNYTTEGGVITGGSNTLGGAISANDSTLNLYGGNLAGNTASSNNGGAVYITNGTLTIDGANILGNYAYCNGGGVFANQSTVTVNDGRISYNRACITDNKGGDGGGIYLSNCTTTMNGGSITHNTNLYDGTGVMNSGGGTFTMNGGTISDNTTTFWGEWSDYCGGTGICNDSDSTLILNDGTIANNIGISKGAGVFNRGTFNMNGGTIEGNICVSLADNIYKGYGDGVANEAGAVFTMTDGYIGVIHNDLVQDDTCRGVYNKGAFTMTGGEIFASSDDMSSCYGLSNSSAYNADGTETSSAVANIGGNAVITGQCGYKPFAVNGTGTVNVSENAVLTAKNVNDCKDNRSRAIYLSRGTLNISGNPELISLHDFGSSNPPDTNGIRFEPSVTVNLSGGPVITAAAHIQLEGTPSEPSTHFNIVGKLEKPVSPYVVVKRIDTNLSEGAFTNGWTEYMSDADHDDYFTGPEGYGVLLYENELRLAEHAHKNIIYSAWEEIDSLPTTAGNYRLESDVTIPETWNVPAGVTNLCLNGHKITYTGNSIAINLVDNVELNVTDCIDSGMLYAESEEDFTGEAHTGIWMSGGKFTMDSGKIYVKNTYPKANVRAIVARNGASLSLSGVAEVEAYGSGAPFGLCTGSEATINISDDAYIYAENIDPSARDGRVRAVYGETGAVINIYGSPVIEAYSPSTTNAVNAIRLNGSTAVFNGTPALIANTDSGLAAEVHCEKTTDLISVNCNLENDTIYRVYKPSNGVITASENTEYNDASKFASAIDDYKVTKESDGQLYIVEVSYYTITAVATEGGNAEGTSTVKEGENVTFTAVADEGYEFIGWFEGETKVCDTEKFVVENVTADKTYTAKFELIKVEEPEIPEDAETVCYIDSNGYTSLAEAVADANNGDVIWMTANDNLSGNITITQSITIELEGYNLPNACIKFEGNIDVKLNDRVGTAVLNSNHNIGYKITNDFSSDSRPRASFYLTGGADVTISGATGGTKFYGGTNEGLPKAFVVGKGCSLTVNGGTMVYEGGYGSDGIFVCDTGVLTLNDILIDRYTNDKNGSSLSYANVPTTENPLTIKKGHFYGGMWVEGSATINGVSISYGILTFEKIEKALLYTSEGSYIDYDKSTSSNGWEIYIASNSLSTDTEIDNEIDATEALRVSEGGDIVAQVGQKIVFQPQVTGGDGATEITYMWEKDGADSGVTANIYTIEVATIDDEGEYVFTATQGNISVSCTYVLSVEGTQPDEEPEAEHYNIWCGEYEFTSDNLVIDNTDNSAISGSATFDPDTYTLTLDQFSYTGAGGAQSDYERLPGVGLFFSNPEINPDAPCGKLVLHGTNYIDCVSDGSLSCAVYIIGSAEISGDGSLTARASFDGVREGNDIDGITYAICCTSTLSVKDSTITAITDIDSDYAYGLTAGSLELDNANITASGDKGSIYLFAGGTFDAAIDGHRAFVSNNKDGSDATEYGPGMDIAAYKYAKIEPIENEEPEDPEKPDEPVINEYTVTANATDGGVAEGTATVEEGESVVLTAEAYEGYEFIGWYDGTALVCETEEFVVENVKANKTYTARFVLIEVEEPEKPEAPSIPELSFDGEVLTLVDESEIALRVGVSYVGSAVFDEKNVDWDRMVYVGKKYEEINGESGYRTYENFTSQAFDKAGNYVSYVKYAIGEEVSSYYYLFTVAGEAESIVLPYLTFSDNTLTMVNDMGISATVGYAYVGAEVFNSRKVDWNRFVEVGKQYSDINTERGYVREVDITEFSKEFSRNGNYVAYIKYNDPNTGKSVSEYTTFTVDFVPVVTADRGRIVVEANGNDLSKITIAYIGDSDKKITDWTSFAQASNIYKEINGDPQKQQYSNLKNTNRFGQDIDGYYAVYVRYGNEVSDKIVRYYTIYVDNTDMVVKPVAQGSQDGNISIIDEGYEILKTTIAYVGTTEKTVYDWNGFMEAANVFKDINGDPPMQQYFNIEQGKLFHQKYDGYYIVFIRYDDEGSTLSTYSTVWVDNSNAVTPEITAENGRIVLSDNGVDVQKVTIAYIGEADKEICNWTQFATASNAYKEINGDPQKQQYHTPSDGSEFVQNLDGWYAVYIRYTDENGKAVSIYKTINVTDTALVVRPEAVANGADIVINANGCEISKVTIAYIGDEEKKITNWNEFSTASNVYKDINGDPQKQQYHNPKDAAVYTQNQAGYYAVYLRYTAGGVSNTVYSVVYVEV